MSNSTKTSPKSTWEPKENAEFFAGITWELSTLGANGKQAGWPADKVEAFKALKSRIRGAVTYAELNAASISPDAVKALKDIYEIVKGSSNEVSSSSYTLMFQRMESIQ